MGKRENVDGQPYTVFVTDYTRNDQLESMPSFNDDPKLARRILQIEMWDSASATAREMQPGEFYRLDNVRMMNGSSGYLEAKFVEGRKAQLLDHEAADADQHLQALLR